MRCIGFIFLSSLAWLKMNAQESAEQPYTVPNTSVRKISSEVNGIDYKLYISYPASFNESTNQYPVLYTLDADYSFVIAKSIVDHLTQRNHLQEMIVVGIAYDGPLQYRLNRTRDYTPTNSVEVVSFPEIQKAHSGGAELFKRFIEEELQPYINEKFRGNGFSAISGHSYGGLFASWIMTQFPTVFDGYIIVSPSLWYDDRLIFREKWTLSEMDNIKFRSYLGVGDREVNAQWNMPRDLQDFTKQIDTNAEAKMDLKLRVYENETHNSIFPAALSDGIRYVFKGI